MRGEGAIWEGYGVSVRMGKGSLHGDTALEENENTAPSRPVGYIEYRKSIT